MNQSSPRYLRARPAKIKLICDYSSIMDRVCYEHKQRKAKGKEISGHASEFQPHLRLPHKISSSFIAFVMPTSYERQRGRKFLALLQPRILPLPPTTYYLPTLLQPRILLLPPTTYHLLTLRSEDYTEAMQMESTK